MPDDNEKEIDGISARIGKAADERAANDLDKTIENFKQQWLNRGDAYYFHVRIPRASGRCVEIDDETITIDVREFLWHLNQQLRPVHQRMYRAEAFATFLERFSQLQNSVEEIQNREE